MALLLEDAIEMLMQAHELLGNVPVHFREMEDGYEVVQVVQFEKVEEEELRYPKVNGTRQSQN